MGRGEGLEVKREEEDEGGKGGKEEGVRGRIGKREEKKRKEGEKDLGGGKRTSNWVQ